MANNHLTAAWPIQTTLHGHIALITLNNPPVNALGVALRQGLLSAITQAQTNDVIRAVVIAGAGSYFIGGADIREFGLPPQAPLLPEVCQAIESCSKLVVSAIQGVALGGGLEVALASHYRVAHPAARLGLPEVQLGLLPGAGGTQRVTRLLGAEAALDLMLSGRHVRGDEALHLGLVDHISLGENTAAEGVAFAQQLLAQGAPIRRTGQLTEALSNRAVQQAAIDVARAAAAKQRGLFAPLKIVDCVQSALDKPLAEGLRDEREHFMQCMQSPQRAGLIHAFFAEREAAKLPEAQTGQARCVEQVGVVGGGTMGAGIAVSMLDAGLQVTMIERDADALALGRLRVEKVYDSLVAKGRLTVDAKQRVLQRFSGATDYAALSAVDLVVEAVFEDMAVKQAVFAQLDQHCKAGAVLATNTSYLDINALASSIARPHDVIGLHFFSPANIMKLLEIVVPNQVSADVVATSFELARRLKKVAVRAGVCDGFIGNRILAVYRQAADHMLEDGASPYEVDAMVKAFGYPMGPYEMSDLAGGDIGWATRKRRAATRDPRARYVPVADRLCERGWFGQKTGRGWYRYEAGSRIGTPDPEVLAIVQEERALAGVTPRNFTASEMQQRYLAAMINESAKVVEEGIALRPLDVDVVLVHGYGFPRHHGGPMHCADTMGLPQVLASIQTYAQADPLFWQPAQLLVQLVEAGRDFNSLNQPLKGKHHA